MRLVRGGREEVASVPRGPGRVAEYPPQLPRVDLESWVQLWVEKEDGTTLMVCRARLQELPDQTVLDKVEACKGFEQYSGPLQRSAE